MKSNYSECEHDLSVLGEESAVRLPENKELPEGLESGLEGLERVS